MTEPTLEMQGRILKRLAEIQSLLRQLVDIGKELIRFEKGKFLDK